MDERTPEVLDQFSIQIARVVLASGFYEDALTETIRSVLDLTTLQANALVRPLGARSKLDLLCRLAKAAKINAAEVSAISKHAEKAKKAFESRNAIIHGQFGHNAEGKVSVRSYGGKEKLTGRPKRWTLRMICDVGSLIQDLQENLAEVCDPLTSAGPLPETLVPGDPGFHT